MKRNRALWLLVVALLVSGGGPTPGGAQVMDRLRKKAEEAAKKRAEEDAKKKQQDAKKAGVASDSARAAPAKVDSTKPVESKAATATPATSPAPARVWENYDFVPGNRVLFYSDFSEDRVGNFARGLKYQSGALEVVERDDIKVLRATARSQFLVPVGKRLPERFTLEVDVISPSKDPHEMLTLEGGPDINRGSSSASIVWMTARAWIQGGGQSYPSSGVEVPGPMQEALMGTAAHVRILMDSGYFKMYVNERRLYNIPELPFRRDSVIRVMVNATEALPVYITSIRVAESETSVLYDALSAKGRWATQGILFATGKADVQPESRPVLKEIAATLRQHPELKVLIEGHTDNVGSATSNLSLSDARAAAVKAALVADFGADGDRITTKGLGDTKPSVPNATASGRAQNRRVEVVRQ